MNQYNEDFVTKAFNLTEFNQQFNYLVKLKDIANLQILLDSLIKSKIDISTKKYVIDILEKEFIHSNNRILCRYLFYFYDELEEKDIAKFYLDLSFNEIESNDLFIEKIKSYKLSDYISIDLSHYHQYNYASSYIYNENKFSYTIYSFSNKIGQNLTLIKTHYGDIIFDCGAKCSSDAALEISENDLRNFLFATKTRIDDIIGVFISHAHLDHYGSIATLLNIGISDDIIYMNNETKKLIQVSAKNMPSLSNFVEPNIFNSVNDEISVTPFYNGHILGSCGYIISFDNINIVFSGDFCLHNQLTVHGLDFNDILADKNIQMYGIDCLITESTYGQKRKFLDYQSSIIALKHFVKLMLDLGYKIFMPSFAIGRSQELSMMLNDKYKIVLDGLASETSFVYENLTGLKIYNDNTRFSNETDIVDKLNNYIINDIIISSSGMINKDSMSFNYLSELLNKDNNVALITTGYISSESYGNELLNEWMKNNRTRIDISLSAHASYDEIKKFIEVLNPREVVSVHGDGLLVKDKNYYDNSLSSNEVIEKIVISDENLKIKLNNFLKLTDELLNNNINLLSSSSFIFNYKLLMKNFSSHKDYELIVNKISSLTSIDDIVNYLKEIVLNKFEVSIVVDNHNNNENLNENKTNNGENTSAEKVDTSNNIVNFNRTYNRTKNAFESDIMIVKMRDDDYFVSEKIHGKDAYVKLLKQRSRNSNHYYSYDDALLSANHYLEYVKSKDSPNAEILYYDIEDFQKRNSEESSEILDGDGFVVCKKINKKVEFIYRDDEQQYRYVNNSLYFSRLYSKIKNIEQDNSINFENLGMVYGYSFSFECNIPLLRYELKKVDIELNSIQLNDEIDINNKDYFTGYKKALLDAINIQKECSLCDKEIVIHIIDIRDNKKPFRCKGIGLIDSIVNYKVRLYNDYDLFVENVNELDFYIIYLDTSEKENALLDIFALKNNCNFYFIKKETNDDVNIPNPIIEGDFRKILLLPDEVSNDSLVVPTDELLN